MKSKIIICTTIEDFRKYLEPFASPMPDSTIAVVCRLCGTSFEARAATFVKCPCCESDVYVIFIRMPSIVATFFNEFSGQVMKSEYGLN